MAKTPPGDFQVTIPEISLLSQQAVISKEISVQIGRASCRERV